MKYLLTPALFCLAVSFSLSAASAQTTVNSAINNLSSNWSLPATWSGGVVPNNGGGKTYDVNLLNSVISVPITLDIDVTIHGLTLGQGSQLNTDSSKTLTTGTLSNDGTISFSGGNTLTVTGDMSTSGTVSLAGGSALNVGGNLSITYLPAGVLALDDSTLKVTGNVDNSGTVTTSNGSTLAVNGVFSNGAQVYLSGPGDSATLGSLMNSGTVDLGDSISLTVTGAVDNSGSIGMSGGSTPPNTFKVGGAFTNESTGYLELAAGGNSATLVSLSNAGLVGVESGGILNVTGNVINSNSLGFGGGGLNVGGSLTNTGTVLTIGAGSTLHVAGAFVNQGFGELDLGSAGGSANFGSLTNKAFTSVFVYGTSALNVLGNVDNSSYLTTGYTPSFATFGDDNTVDVGGTFTNEANGLIALHGVGDTANINTLVNHGQIFINPGTTLNLTGGGPGITNILAGSQILLEGTLNVINGGIATNALGNLTNINGNLLLNNGQTTSDTPGSAPLTISSSGLLSISSGAFNVNGGVNNSGQVQVDTTSTLTVSGFFDNQSSSGFGVDGTASVGSLNNAGGLTVNGTLNVAGNLSNSSSQFSMSGGLNVGGTLTNQSTGRIGLGGSTTVGQTFANGGIVQVSQLGLLAVGSGTLNPDFGYQQFADGTLHEMIQQSMTFGFTNVDGGVLLGGALDVTLANGFTPGIGETFDILNFVPNDLTGTFFSIENDVFNHGTEKWVVDYDNSTGQILLEVDPTNSTTSSTPEPASLLLLGTGIMAIASFARRKLRFSTSD